MKRPLVKKMMDHLDFTTFEGRKRRRELKNEVSLDLLEFTIYCLCVGEGVTRF